MLAKIDTIKQNLGIDASSAPQAVAAANEVLGLQPSGPLPQQVEALMAALGLGDAAAKAAPTGAAAGAGPPMRFSLRCSDGQTVEASLAPTESVGALMLAVQRATGIHAATQRLVFAGQALPTAEAIDKTPLVDGATIFVLVTNEASFPAKLGPFQTAAVPFAARDLSFFVGADLATAGCMWTMEPGAVARQRLQCPGVEFPLCGQFSPTHPVTLTAEEKAAIHIPAAASQFVFSYPVVSGTKLSVQPGGSDTAASFLSVGGFAYLDADARLLHATTLLPSASAEGGLQFAPPRRWRPEWTTALMRQGRFQRITIKPLNDLGALHFCWLRPGERIEGCAEQPAVPHGGFAYLFHENALGGTADELALDRFFAVASGEDYVKGTGGAAAAGTTATFAVVSDLSTLNELRDRLPALEVAATRADGAAGAAGAAGASAEAEEMRAQIGRLESQLEQATRCVVCLDQAKDTMIDPCGHLCVCEGCAAQLRACPLCRGPIRGRRKAYAS